MSKNTITYWNTLAPENQGRWQEVSGSNGMLLQITLAIDEVSGD